MKYCGGSICVFLLNYFLGQRGSGNACPGGEEDGSEGEGEEGGETAGVGPDCSRPPSRDQESRRQRYADVTVSPPWSYHSLTSCRHYKRTHTHTQAKQTETLSTDHSKVREGKGLCNRPETWEASAHVIPVCH